MSTKGERLLTQSTTPLADEVRWRIGFVGELLVEGSRRGHSLKPVSRRSTRAFGQGETPAPIRVASQGVQ
jgi:hypothetical protein